MANAKAQRRLAPDAPDLLLLASEHWKSVSKESYLSHAWIILNAVWQHDYINTKNMLMKNHEHDGTDGRFLSVPATFVGETSLKAE